MPREVLLVGSVPLADAETVFREAGTRLKGCAHRLPDGETGERLTWIGFQWRRLRQVDGLEQVGALKWDGPVPQELPRFRFAEGRTPQNVDIGRLGYDEIAARSYEIFKRARAAGQIGEGIRFQVSLPTPAMLATAIDGALQDVLPLFERAMAEEIKSLTAKIPPRDLAIQWDVAGETEGEEARRHPENAAPMPRNPTYTLNPLLDSIARVSNLVPPEVELGIHLCFGDPDGKHIIEPVDASVPADMANILSERIKRPLAYIHVPVPIARDDEAYFAPLKGLKLEPGTRLILGLIHQEDGVEGAKRRMRAADKSVRDYGVATECGLGRVAPDIILPLLDLHRDVAKL